MSNDTKLVRGLSLLDSILLLAGGIIGSGIFLTGKEIAENTRSPLLFLLVWVSVEIEKIYHQTLLCSYSRFCAAPA